MTRKKCISTVKLFKQQYKTGKRFFLICLNFLLLYDYENKTDEITSFFLREDEVISYKKRYYDDLLELYTSIKSNTFKSDSLINITFLTKQIIDGAHRLAICLFLKIESIPYKTTHKLFVKNDLEWFFTCGFSKQKLIELKNKVQSLIFKC